MIYIFISISFNFKKIEILENIINSLEGITNFFIMFPEVTRVLKYIFLSKDEPNNIDKKEMTCLVSFSAEQITKIKKEFSSLKIYDFLKNHRERNLLNNIKRQLLRKLRRFEDENIIEEQEVEQISEQISLKI